MFFEPLRHANGERRGALNLSKEGHPPPSDPSPSAFAVGDAEMGLRSAGSVPASPRAATSDRAARSRAAASDQHATCPGMRTLEAAMTILAITIQAITI